MSFSVEQKNLQPNIINMITQNLTKFEDISISVTGYQPSCEYMNINFKCFITFLSIPPGIYVCIHSHIHIKYIRMNQFRKALFCASSNKNLYIAACNNHKLCMFMDDTKLKIYSKIWESTYIHYFNLKWDFPLPDTLS